MNSSPNPEPTISMAFIAGLLALMSILSLFFSTKRNFRQK